jgi:hypothetical protein
MPYCIYRYNLDEKKDVFYSHEDIHRFNAEYNREFDLCESLEIDWNDWMADRTEEEILRFVQYVGSILTSFFLGIHTELFVVTCTQMFLVGI